MTIGEEKKGSMNGWSDVEGRIREGKSEMQACTGREMQEGDDQGPGTLDRKWEAAAAAAAPADLAGEVLLDGGGMGWHGWWGGPAAGE